MDLPQPVLRGLSEQLRRHRSQVEAGARPLGWKIAFNLPAAQQALGLPHALAAPLRETSRLGAGAIYALGERRRVALEAEIAVRLGAPVRAGDPAAAIRGAIEAWAPAIEVVELDRPFEELEAILAEGVFHRAVAFGSWSAPRPGAHLSGMRVRVTLGEREVCEVDAGDATGDPAAVLGGLARVLEGMGTSLRASDVVILGSMNPMVFATPGAIFRVDASELGSVELQLGE